MKTTLTIIVEHDTSWDYNSLFNVIKSNLESKKGIQFGVKSNFDQFHQDLDAFTVLFKKTCEDYKKSLPIGKGDIVTRVLDSKKWAIADITDSVIKLVCGTDDYFCSKESFLKEFIR